MGTDIHAYVEIQQPDGTWKYLDEAVFPNPYYRPDETNDPFGWNTEKTNQPFRSRNYDLFGVLAGVRTEHPQIVEERGLPDDMSPGLAPLRVDMGSLNEEDQERASQWPWLGDHTYTWLTVRELLEFDWDSNAQHAGYLTFPAWKKFVIDEKRLGEGPQSWCRDVYGQHLKKIKETDHTTDEIIALHKELDPPEMDHNKAENGVVFSGARLYIWTVWGNTCRQAVGPWIFNNIFPVLKQLAEEAGGQDKVRIVMGFDS